MRTISVGTVSISITNIVVAFINIYEHNRFAKGKWREKKILAILWDNETIIFNEQLFCFFLSLI